MSVRIRLRRVGRKKQPSYRIVVAESSTPRGGVYIENVGFYNPRRDPIELRVDLERVDHWLERGALLTPTVASLVRKVRRGEAGEATSAAAAPAKAAPAEAPAAETPKAEEPKAEPAAEEPKAEAPAAPEAPAEAEAAPEAAEEPEKA